MLTGGLAALVIMGLIGLVGGWFPASRGRAVRGIHARFLGLISILALPSGLAACFLAGVISALIGMPIPKEMWETSAILIQLVVMGIFIALVTYLSYRWSDPARSPESALILDPEFVANSIAKPAPTELDDEFFLGDPGTATSSGMARASLMLGLFSLLTSLLASIPAFILGGIALSRIARSGGRIAGKGAAVAGIVLGIVGTFTGFIALALLLPFLRAGADPGPAPPTPPIAVRPLTKTAPVPANPSPPIASNVEPENAAKTKKANPTRLNSPKAKARSKGGLNRPDRPAPTLAIDSKPESTGVSLASKPRKVTDLTVTDLKVQAAKVPRCLAWGEDGAVVFILETDGTLRRVKLDGFVEELKWEIGQKCSWLSVSSEGLVLTVDSLQEVWSLDPKTFEIKTRTAVSAVTRAESSPAIPFAFAIGKSGDSLAVIDLKAGKILHEYDSRSIPGQVVGFARLVVAPDGKSVYGEGMERLIRFDIVGDELNFADQTDRIAQNGKAIEISADGAYVALPSGGGNYGEPRYSTFVYRTTNLSDPKITITSGAYPQALGFDLKTGFLYAQNSEDSLILFQPSGAKAKSYRLATGRGRGNPPRQFLVHPDGGKLFALSDSSLSFVELPSR